MNDDPPLSLPRLLAIQLLHAAQIAGAGGCAGLVGARERPCFFLPFEENADFDAACAQLAQRGLQPWARFAYRPAAPTAPAAADFAVQPALLRLSASLATRGVLQLRAWRCVDGKVTEQDLRIVD